jgi:hypothetical protein
MRNRHRPRLCRNCRAPMAGQEDSCWRCGVEWAPEQSPRTTLRLVPATAPTRAEDVPEHRIPVPPAARGCAVTDVRLDAERWTNEGGSFQSHARMPRRAAVRR